MDKNYLLKHWYADIYEQQNIDDEEVQFILSIIGDTPKKILEVACGGGRISIPMAQAGHLVTGFDFDEFMLEKIPAKAKGLRNLSYYKADAVSQDWGSGYDIVVLGGNILVNIVTDMDYRQAQELFIKKASDSVVQGGHIFLEFSLVNWPDQTTDDHHEWVCFEGTDDLGTYGKYIVVSGEYSSNTRIDKSSRRFEITPEGGEMFTSQYTWIKHFPMLSQVESWLEKADWEVECLYGDYQRNPVSDKSSRAIFWARKL